MTLVSDLASVTNSESSAKAAVTTIQANQATGTTYGSDEIAAEVTPVLTALKKRPQPADGDDADSSAKHSSCCTNAVQYVG